MRGVVLVVAIVLVGLVGARGVARADDKPWAVGVSKADQKAALELYQQANDLFDKDLYKDALKLYTDALARWDHPQIHYNAAICLMRLDRILEANEHLLQALAYGDAPLGRDLYKEARGYEKLFAKQIGEIEVTVAEPVGAAVSLDGKPLFVAPGTQTRRVLVGSHKIVVEKPPTYLTETKDVSIAGERKEVVTIKLRKREAARRLTRRWAVWKPWAVMATGVVVAGVGVPFYLRAQDEFEQFDKAVATAATDQEPVPASALRDREDGYRAQNFMYGAIAVGGAVVATGLILVIANQPRLGPVITPQVGTDRVGIAISAPLW